MQPSEATAPPDSRRAGALRDDGGAGGLRVLEHGHDVAQVAGPHDGEVVGRGSEGDRRVERVGPPHVGVGDLTMGEALGQAGHADRLDWTAQASSRHQRRASGRTGSPPGG